MAEGVIPNEADKVFLDYTLGLIAPAFWALRLYVNDVTPDRDTVFGDLTEPTDPSYLPSDVIPADWTLTSEPDGWFGALLVRSFIFSAGETVFGWFLNAGDFSAGDRLLAVGRFAAPVTIPSTGGSLPVTLTRLKLRGLGG